MTIFARSARLVRRSATAGAALCLAIGVPAVDSGQAGWRTASVSADWAFAGRADQPATPTPARAKGDAPAIRLHGLVEPVRSYVVAAPRVTGGAGGGPGGPLVIVQLARAGTRVQKGNLLVEFDRTTQLKNARDREAEYGDLLAQIDRKRAGQLTARAAREAGLGIAANAVRRAELDLVGLELLPSVTAEKNQQALAEARARLAQLRTTHALHEKAEAADLRILEIQRDRAKNAWDHAASNATRMRIVSPLDGLVVLRAVFRSGTMAEMQEGEEVRPGIPILDVVDATTMRVRAAVNQADVGLLTPGMAVKVTLDSFPSRTFPGRLQHLSPVATTSTMSPRVRTFVAIFSIDGADEHLLPDLAAAIEFQPANGAEGSSR
jgi:multidrug efflux pump subunit AcrA (membrane-fusion protein)